MGDRPLRYPGYSGGPGPRVILVRDEGEEGERGRKGYEPFWDVQRMICGTEMRLVGFEREEREGLREWWMERRRRRVRYGGKEGGGGEVEETGDWGWVEEEDGREVVIGLEDKI